MKRLLSPLVALTAGGTVLLGSHPALAHGNAAGGALGGLGHPLLGLDHLVMLLAVGTAAALISPRLLLWALGGSVVGAAIGCSGFSVGSAEVLAALAISAVGAVTLLANRPMQTSNANGFTTVGGFVVATGVSIHAMLHGLEAPQDGSTLAWWAGALLSSVLVCGATTALLRQAPVSVSKTAAMVVLVVGGLLSLAPLGLLAATAGA